MDGHRRRRTPRRARKRVRFSPQVIVIGRQRSATRSIRKEATLRNLSDRMDFLQSEIDSCSELLRQKRQSQQAKGVNNLSELELELVVDVGRVALLNDGNEMVGLASGGAPDSASMDR